MISLDDYKMGRDKQYPKEWTAETEKNAVELLKRVNSLLSHLGYVHGTLQITSGFRPLEINKKVGGSAKSGHVVGKAVDISDSSNALKKQITKELLEKFDLWMEHPLYTQGWCHLDISVRKNRIFIPY